MFGTGMHVVCSHGNTTETKTDIAKFISFRVKFFHFHFCNFFVSVSISINVNHTKSYFRYLAVLITKVP